MNEPIKVIIAGLDNAGKTSILTALDKRYNFIQEVKELQPTVKVRYQRTDFLENDVVFWDMGGQEKYRTIYSKRPSIYFDGTNLLIYVIDIQDRGSFQDSLDYLDTIMSYFKKNNIKIPMIVALHKYDPKIRSNDEIEENVNELSSSLKEQYPNIDILFQQTSIYDIISIVQLISYGLSVFDNRFFELSVYLEKLLNEFDCTSIILYNNNGLILSESYQGSKLSPSLYFKFIDSMKKHICEIKKIEENIKETDPPTIEGGYISYLHRFYIFNEPYYLSIVLSDLPEKRFKKHLKKFVKGIKEILKPIHKSKN